MGGRGLEVEEVGGLVEEEGEGLVEGGREELGVDVGGLRMKNLL